MTSFMNSPYWEGVKKRFCLGNFSCTSAPTLDKFRKPFFFFFRRKSGAFKVKMKNGIHDPPLLNGKSLKRFHFLEYISLTFLNFAIKCR